MPGIFDNLIGSSEDKKEEVREKKAYDFSKQQSIQELAHKNEVIDGYLPADRTELLRWQQDFKEEIMVLRSKFLGLYRDKDGTIKENKDRAICNIRFFDEVVDPTLFSFLNKNFINSNLTDLKINDLLKRNFNNLATTLVKKHREYEIEFKDFDIITRELKNILIPAGYRALKGWTKKTDSTMIKRVESEITQTGEENKKNILGFETRIGG